MLTTPQMNEKSAVSPGESWFFYWKTSASLWEEKLSKIYTSRPLLIPIYWALHSETGDNYDFANVGPETDLKRLSEIIKSQGKEAIFLIPQTPLPFLPNGGIPSLLARMLSTSKDGIVNAFIDSEGQVNKFYSFFDPRVFSAYRKFVWEVGRYFQQENIGHEIAGIRGVFFENGREVSYIDDSSKAFLQGYYRFKNSDGPDRSIVNEDLHKLHYRNMIEQLYEETARECLGGSWIGTMKFFFLGGQQRDIFYRSCEKWDNGQTYMDSIIESITYNAIPTTALVSEHKSEGLANFVEKITNNSSLYNGLDSLMYDSSGDLSFRSLTFFNIYLLNEDTESSVEDWKKTGVLRYLNEQYKGTFRYKTDFKEVLEDEIDFDDVHFFSGKSLNDLNFQHLLKLFMSGGQIIIDSNEMAEEMQRKLELLILENSLNTEEVFFHSKLRFIEIGNGKIILFNSKEIESLGQSKKNHFWNKILQFFEIDHLLLQEEQGVYYHWSYRVPTSNELQFEQIRRVHIYNPTSYKRKLKISNKNNFAFLKILDEKFVNFRNGPFDIEIVLMPGGSCAIDFGHFEP